jgi:hypothetical protein
VSRGRSSSSARRLDTGLANAIEEQRGTGRPLPSSVRRRLEPVLGANLGAVRLHDGPPADGLAGSLDAEAFTVGSDVFVRGQRDLTATADGQEVLAHELSHVAQQQGAPAVVQRLPRPEWLKRLARRLGSGNRASEASETPYQPIPAFAPESPYQPIPGFPGGDRPHRFSGAYGVPIPARVDDEPEGGHYNTIPNFDDEPEGGHYNTIPDFSAPTARRLSGPYGVPIPATQQEMARRLADAAVAKQKKVRKRVRFAE